MPNLFLIIYAAILLVFFLGLAVVIKLLERALTFNQALLLSAVANVANIVLFTLYDLASARLGIPAFAGLFASLGIMSLPGLLVTRLAERFGIRKTGWFGIGAKAMASLYALSFVLIAFGSTLLWAILGH